MLSCYVRVTSVSGYLSSGVPTFDFVFGGDCVDSVAGTSGVGGTVTLPGNTDPAIIRAAIAAAARAYITGTLGLNIAPTDGVFLVGGFDTLAL